MQSFKRWSQAVLFIAAACLITSPGQATQVDLTDIIFQEVEKRLIREYFSSRDRGTAEASGGQEQYRKGKGAKRGKGARRGKGAKRGKGARRGKSARRGKGRQNRRHGKKQRNRQGKNGPPPGLARKQGLPPGLARQKRLPPGLTSRALPADLDHALPAAPAGTERVIIDNNVVLIQKATGLVLDILSDAVRQSR